MRGTHTAIGAALTLVAWQGAGQQPPPSTAANPAPGCTATAAQLEANKKVAMHYEVFTFDTFRVRNGKLVEHWDGAVINPPAPVGGGRQ